MTVAVPEERATAAGISFSLANAAGSAIGGLMIQSGWLGLPIVLGSAAYILGGLAFGLGFRNIKS